MRAVLAHLTQAASRAAVAGLVVLVRLYQVTVSPLLGPCCRYAPSCSAYAIEALRRHGAVRGTLLASWRILRCHPLAEGGYDPVPERRQPAGTEPRAEARGDVGAAGPAWRADHASPRPSGRGSK